MQLMANYFTPMAGAREMPEFVWLVLGLLIYSVAFVHIYGKGAGSDSKVNEGMRFGVWATLLAWAPMGLIWYALLDFAPISEYLVDIVYRLLQMIIVGILVAHLTGIPGGGGDREGGKGGTG
jgi:hypothetical protein